MTHLYAKIKNVPIFNENLNLINQILKDNRITVISHLSHTFSNGAHTYLFLLAESHCSIHEWTELNEVFIDLFTCGDCDTKKALSDIIEKAYFVKDYEIKEIDRF